jgi:Na+/proline symporter
MLGLTPLDIAIVLSYFVAIIAIGLISSRFVRNREDFLMGGRRFGKVLMVFFSFGAGTNADAAVGVVSQCYKVGFAGIWYQWSMLFTLPIYWLMAVVLRRMRVLTTADYFARRFGPGLMLLYSGFSLFVCITFTGVMLYGAARLIEALTGQAIPWQAGIPLLAIFGFAYGVLGGLIAAVWNDLFQGILTIVMSVLIIPFFWMRIGGLGGFQQALPDPAQAFQMVMQSEMTIFWVVMVSVNSLFSAMAQPHLMPSVASGRNELDSQVGYVGGMFLKRLMTVPWALTGVMAIALFGPGAIEPDHAFGRMAREVLPVGGAGLMLACVMASVMDNCALNMLTFAGIYSNNIHKHFFPANQDERQWIRVSRISSCCFGVLSIGLAYCFTDVPAAMRFIWNTVPILGIPFLLGLLWRRYNRAGAYASVSTAFIAMLTAVYGLGWHGDAGLPKTITLFLGSGILAGVVVSLCSQPEPRGLLDRFYLLIRTPIGCEDVLHRAGMTEIPGTGTFEIKKADQEIDLSNLMTQIPQSARQRTRRQTVWGLVIVTLGMFALLLAVRLLAQWLATG